MNLAEQISAKCALQVAHGDLITLAGMVRPGRERVLVDHISRNVSLAITHLRNVSAPVEYRHSTEDVSRTITCPHCGADFQSKATVKTACATCRAVIKFEKGRWKAVGGTK